MTTYPDPVLLELQELTKSSLSDLIHRVNQTLEAEARRLVAEGCRIEDLTVEYTMSRYETRILHKGIPVVSVKVTFEGSPL
jgi:hypothetical protein